VRRQAAEESLTGGEADDDNAATCPPSAADGVHLVLGAPYIIPSEYAQFLQGVVRCVNPTETAWFICIDDYHAQPENSFRWDELECLSLAAAGGDESWVRSVREFWDTHLPYFVTVEQGYYSYNAVDLVDGSVVHGESPEFEEVTTVAESFFGFLDSIVSGRVVVSVS